MNPDESYIFSLLRNNSNCGEWRFFELRDERGNTIQQSKLYPGFSFWTAYPDFEYYENEKLLLLAEVKGYDGYYNQQNDILGMKYTHFQNYKTVKIAEKVDVRVCILIKFKNGERQVFWESIAVINSFPYSVIDIKNKKCII